MKRSMLFLATLLAALSANAQSSGPTLTPSGMLFKAHIMADGTLTAGSGWIDAVTIERHPLRGSTYHLRVHDGNFQTAPVCTVSGIVNDNDSALKNTAQLRTTDSTRVSVNVKSGYRSPYYPDDKFDVQDFYLMCGEA